MLKGIYMSINFKLIVSTFRHRKARYKESIHAFDSEVAQWRRSVITKKTNVSEGCILRAPLTLSLSLPICVVEKKKQLSCIFAQVASRDLV